MPGSQAPKCLEYIDIIWQESHIWCAGPRDSVGGLIPEKKGKGEGGRRDRKPLLLSIIDMFVVKATKP